MHNQLFDIYNWANRNKIAAVATAIVVLAILSFFSSRLNFEEDVTKLIPKSENSDATSKVLGQLNFADKITVIFNVGESGNTDDLTAMATMFLDSIASSNQYIKSIQGRVDEYNIDQTFSFVYDNLPLFLDEDDYIKIGQKLSRDSIALATARNYRNIISPTGLVSKQYILKDPLGISFIALQKLQQQGVGEDFILQDGFIVTKDKTKLLLFINPRLPSNETNENEGFVDNLNDIKNSLNSEFTSKAQVEYFGSTLIAVANARQIKSDIITTTSIAISILMLILIFYYRQILIPVIIFIPTIFGVLGALALLYFIKGTISAISLGIGAVLLGVTIDYSLHILTHYKHSTNVKALYSSVSRPLIMSSTTTAVAFLCLLFVKSEALQDLGVFAAASVVISSLFSLLLIPHFYKPKVTDKVIRRNYLDRLAGFSFEKNKFLIFVSLAVIAVSLFTFDKVRFTSDISQLNYVPDDIKIAERHLEASTNLTSKSLYVVSYGDNLEDVLATNSNLATNLAQQKQTGQILNYTSSGNLLQTQKLQQEKIERWNTFWTPQKKQQIQQDLIAESSELGFKPTAYESFYELLNKSFEPVPVSSILNIEALSMKEFFTQKNDFFTISTIVKVDPGQRDAVVKNLQSDNVTVIDRQQVNETFLTQLKTDFTTLINYSIIAVLLILYFFFRRIELVLISSIPIFVTGLVTAGIMGIFGLELNIFSTIVCTLIFGHGVDFSIFMTSALQKEFTYGDNDFATYRTSILLAVITTVLAIGALIFAQHPALKSISAISLIGVFSALIITFVFYPMLFRFFFSKRVANGNSPFEFRTLIHSTLSFIYYGLGGFLLSIISALGMKIIPLSKPKKLRMFHYVMSKFMKSVLYSNWFLKKKIVNEHNETFEKPAVIIANHSSFLDILAMGMLNPKIVFLVSDWVYNSPIFGKGVRLAGFYPVSQGIDGGIEHLREKVDQGYSLMVFPEGSRSPDNHIRRFHKGAFYLAEQFNLDIIPVVIHGTSEILPKSDFIINDGPLTLTILNRIKSDDNAFGQDYSERTKNFNAYFRSQYAQIRQKIEGADYFKKLIVGSFAYKEREVVHAVKSTLDQKLNFYHRAEIGTKDRILHLANDYGETDVLLMLQQPQRKIYSFITSEDKRKVARGNHISIKRGILYPESLSEIADLKFDILIISDKNFIADESFLARFRQIIYETPH